MEDEEPLCVDVDIRHFLLFIVDNQAKWEIFRPHDYHYN